MAVACTLRLIIGAGLILYPLDHEREPWLELWPTWYGSVWTSERGNRCGTPAAAANQLQLVLGLGRETLLSARVRGGGCEESLELLQEVFMQVDVEGIFSVQFEMEVKIHSGTGTRAACHDASRCIRIVAEKSDLSLYNMGG
ncbi:hypothetical protein PPTG_21011 [Phytophthora nicotianae INRA-310]|uniref:Uncharacterized protein n=1 Tax=Phytophthora nicotianae (strain INRA-310) TaxID=761204 RepID=W2RDC9_PHYN3|nr:hypothetical protein PPTG_21011 [Phytophthora nicotianae INRA-310]ETN23382.1 hypothetical protein PPTG_21011 [Phytophthora nicotianae INRA-310]